MLEIFLPMFQIIVYDLLQSKYIFSCSYIPLMFIVCVECYEFDYENTD